MLNIEKIQDKIETLKQEIKDLKDQYPNKTIQEINEIINNS